MNILRLGQKLTDAVAALTSRARQLYYAAMLLGCTCPRCGGRLRMVAEGKCRCTSCEHRLDPTVFFQRCSSCGGTPVLQVRRYRCSQCGRDICSRFLFDGLVFDAEYFRRKMAEHRERKKQHRQRVREMLAQCRSGRLDLPAADLSLSPGLVEALNGLTDLAEYGTWQPQTKFDLRRYQSHVQAHIGEFPMSLEEIPPLGEDARRDRIWRFVAIVFLAHIGAIRIWQEGPSVMVSKHDVDTEGPDLPGDVEGTGGYQRALGGIEAW